MRQPPTCARCGITEAEVADLVLYDTEVGPLCVECLDDRAEMFEDTFA